MSNPSDNNNSNLPKNDNTTNNNDPNSSIESYIEPEEVYEQFVEEFADIVEQAVLDSTNSSTQPLPAAEAAAPNSAAQSSDQIGYCHVCDRQVNIDQASFTCSVCNGGFIEILENTPQPNPQTRTTVTTRFINDGNNPISSILPLLLPQLMGQTGVAQQINIPQPGGANPTQQGQSGTRLQFIVPNSEPGEQVDLYGIINNVLSDLLRPGQGGAAQNAQFTFQAPPMRMFQLHSDMRDYAWGAGGLDTIITQLLNQLENTGPPPATEQQLVNLPVVKINEEEFEKKIECAICMEDFRLHEEAKKLPCKHCFHEPCIKEWLKLHGTCPVCRKHLNGEDTSQLEYISRPVTEQAEELSNTENDPENPTNISENSTAQTTSGTPDNSSTPQNSTNQNSNQNNQNSEVYYDMDFD